MASCLGLSLQVCYHDLLLFLLCAFLGLLLLCDVCCLLALVVLHTVEFQKHGLSHAHIIVCVSQDTSHPSAAFIDRYVAAEIPDLLQDHLGYCLVAEHMMHGPCGPNHERCPCMKNGKCSKRVPKKYQSQTMIDENGFAIYKRPDNKRYVQKGGTRLDNNWVVPYNMWLLKQYQAHINVGGVTRVYSLSICLSMLQRVLIVARFT